MKERKNIDRLFQEKFKDFEAHPSDRVWQNIASAKAKKDERKIIPLWWRVGGIAAALILLLAVGNTLFTSETTSSIPVVNTYQKDDGNFDTAPVNTAKPNKESSLENTVDTAPGLATSSSALEENSDKQSSALSPDEINVNPALKDNGTAISSIRPQGSASQRNTRVAMTKDNASEQPFQNDIKQAGSSNPQAVVSNDTPVIQNNNPTTAEKADPYTALSSETTVAATQGQKEDEKDEKLSLIDVAEEINRNKTEEETAVASTTTSQADAKKWRVGAVAAPVYYGDFGGSGIDPQFKDNSKSGDINLSYGVQVSYAVSDKIKLRTGVNNVDLSYGTNDISFRPDIAATKLAGVAPNRNGKFLSVSDKVGPQALQQSDFQGGGSSVSNGSINQQIGYIEVPLEAVFVLSDKRFGVEVIGGVSTLFVNDNEIAIEADGLRTPIGASSSLNDVSFTTNIGVGLNYKVTEKVDINMEPTLKYQLNAFEASAGNFQPYYVGLYTGVSYRF